MKKKIAILDHTGGGRLANQLWNYMSWYAYCFERGYSLENYAFFDYIKYFDIPSPSNIFVNFFFFSLNKVKAYRNLRLYDRFTIFIHKNFKDKIVEDDRINPFYLPPTLTTNSEQIELIKKIEDEKNNLIYISGWLFRNPVGLKKYREQILKYFKPKDLIIHKVNAYVSPIKERYENVFGVHIRQTDYKKWHNGLYYFNPKEVRKIIDEFISAYKIDSTTTAFIVCSDDKIDIEVFKGLNVFAPTGSMVEDMLTLSKTNLILGNDSTFGAFASYYGNIPFVVFERDGVDWDYYRDKDKYFENKKNTLTHY